MTGGRSVVQDAVWPKHHVAAHTPNESTSLWASPPHVHPCPRHKHHSRSSLWASPGRSLTAPSPSLMSESKARNISAKFQGQGSAPLQGTAWKTSPRNPGIASRSSRTEARSSSRKKSNLNCKFPRERSERQDGLS